MAEAEHQPGDADGETEQQHKHKGFHLFETQGLSSITDDELEKTELKLCKLQGALSEHNGNYCVVQRLPENDKVFVVSLPIGAGHAEVHLRPSNLRSPRHAPKKQVRTTTKKDNKEKNRTSPKLAFARVSAELRKGTKMRMKERGLSFMDAMHSLFEDTVNEPSPYGSRIEVEEFIDCVTNLEGVTISKIDANLVCRMFADEEAIIYLEQFEQLLVADDRTQSPHQNRRDRFANVREKHTNPLEPLNQSANFMSKLMSAGINERRQRVEVHEQTVRGKAASRRLLAGGSSPQLSRSAETILPGTPKMDQLALAKLAAAKIKTPPAMKGSARNSPLPPLKSPASLAALKPTPTKKKEKRFETQRFENFYETEGKEMKRKEFFTDSAAIKWYWSKQRRQKQIRRPTSKIQNRNHIGHQL
jgi:hypothetical protein